VGEGKGEGVSSEQILIPPLLLWTVWVKMSSVKHGL
jgi:hypothetical protein